MTHRYLIALALALAGCPPRLPPVSGCAPLEQSCRDDRPYVCSSSQRWEPASDVPCARVRGACVVDHGVAFCAGPTYGGVR